EIRTPLNAILGFTHLMERYRSLGGEQSKRVRIIHSAGQHLLELLNDVLDVATIEAGRMPLTPQELHLHQTLEEIVDVFAQRALDKGLRLDLEVAEGAPAYVRCDGGKLRQVVANLLSDAIKFTTEGHVSVTVAAAS